MYTNNIRSFFYRNQFGILTIHVKTLYDDIKHNQDVKYK